MTCSFCKKEKHTAATCFERVKAEVSIVQVLEHYGHDVVKNHAVCPLPEHQGERKNRPLSVLPNGLGFKCHSCGAKGNVIELVRKMESVGALEAVKKISDWFPPASANQVPVDASGAKKVPMPELRQTPATVQEPPPARNIPLKEKWKNDGRLKNLQHDHEYLRTRGFGETFCRNWGVGVIMKGTSAGRVGFPICNPAGDVVAYSTRSTDPNCPHDQRWRHPKDFEVSLELYGIERLHGSKRVVLVESPWSVLACARAAVTIPAVAMMGKTLSAQQEKLLEGVEPIILMDGDEPGRAGAKDTAERFLREGKPFRILFLEDGEQPDTIDPARLKQMIDGA